MRKAIGFMMAAALMGSLTACGGKTTTETTAATTVAATEATTTETTAADASREETTQAASGETDNKEAGLDAIHTAIKEAYGENYIPSAPFDQAALENVFGVKSDLYDNFIAEGPMISVNVETFVAVEAKEGKAEDVEAALNEHRDRLMADTMQYPMNQVKIQASQVVREGNYVFFIMLGAPTAESEEAGEDEALKSAQENNEIALSVIDSFFN